jgi:hypothetical protein
MDGVSFGPAERVFHVVHGPEIERHASTVVMHCDQAIGQCGQHQLRAMSISGQYRPLDRPLLCRKVERGYGDAQFFPSHH